MLEYLIRTGSERVAEQCKQNIFAIQTLNEFQYLEEGKDQGVNVREKAKLLVGLLRDDERLKNERAKALKARERFAQHPSGFGSDGSVEGPTQHMYGAAGGSGGAAFGAMGGGGAEGGGERRVPLPTEVEFMRPLTVGEEELQLQLAMAMSKEEAAQEESKRRSDDVRLQLALSQSEQDFKDDDSPVTPPQHHQQHQQQPQQSHLLDLLDINLGAMSVGGQGAMGGGGGGGAEAWNIPGHGAMGGMGGMMNQDPWGRTTSPPVDPWAPARSGEAAVDPWLGGGGAGGASGGAVTNGVAFNNHNNHGASRSSNNGVADPWLGNNGHGAGLLDQKPTNGSLLNQLNNNNNNGLGGDPWSNTMNNNNSHSNNNNQNNNHGGGAGGVLSSDPWGPGGVGQMGARPSPVGAITTPSGELDEFDIITNRTKTPANQMGNYSDLEGCERDLSLILVLVLLQTTCWTTWTR